MNFGLQIFIELCIGAIIFWLLSIKLSRVDFVDVLWGSAFVYVGVRCYVHFMPSGFAQWVYLGMIAIWGSRLSVYLLSRMKPEEDKRYQSFREKYGPHRYWWVSLFQTFLLQAILVFLVSRTFIVFFSSSIPVSSLSSWLMVLGFIVWLTGFIYESVADYQLFQFKKNSQGICNKGLWGYSRHPNYFGEFMLWWGFGLFAFSSMHITAFVGPIIMTLLLLKVSGVPMLEKHMKQKKGYEEYYRSVPSLFPCFKCKKK
ncbi:DUF1295 domain-containing protein [Halosquirtibacter xylanolyticus]|uniref:DUF1295 domain-containing protein n=1 Tax=Halosquirtibacter xylanolyticus TaxID=3374599 RepID=UPI003747936A|nr:DUF1295 domain-containing protein [Prolixibacteraceae bacterium]